MTSAEIAGRLDRWFRYSDFALNRTVGGVLDRRVGVSRHALWVLVLLKFITPPVFVWPWAVLYRQLGWFGFAEMLVFIGILMFGFAYIWRKGGFEWE